MATMSVITITTARPNVRIHSYFFIRF